MSPGYCRLWRNQHPHNTKASQVIRYITLGGTHHHPRHDGGMMQHAKDSRKMRIKVQCMDYLAPVDRSDVLVVSLRAYDFVLGLQWFPKQNPDINLAR
jgi:hypothetical protein